MATVLLPSWEQDATWGGEVIGKVFDPQNEEPDAWKPRLSEVNELDRIEAFAFPTPFAWAEMMAAVLREDLHTHILSELYQDMVLGLTLGYLHLDIIDLKQLEFGKVLVEADARYRYLGLLRGTPKNRELQGKLFGATSPHSLFWPSSRRSSEEWTILRAAINSDANIENGYQLLADYTELLQEGGAWDPESIPWMKGFDRIVQNYKPSPEHRRFHLHSRLVGPILVDVPGGQQKPLYVPVHHERFVADFTRALTGSFKKEEDHIGVYDDRDVKQYEIMMPSPPPDGDLILAGAGTIRVVEMRGRVVSYNSQRIRLQDDERGPGLFSLLQPLYAIYATMGEDIRAIREHPLFYPDILRILITRLGEAGLPDTDVSFSDRALELAFDINNPGLPLISELKDHARGARGFILPHSHEGETRRIVYIEEYADYPVGDLKALGWVLWLFFTGEAEFRDGKIRDKQLIPLLSESTPTRPFDASSDAYRKLNEERDRHRRLATLQRLVKAYAERGRSENASPVNRLCYAAARSFAKWVWPDQPEILENGHLPGIWQEMQIGDLVIQLARDEG